MSRRALSLLALVLASVVTVACAQPTAPRDNTVTGSDSSKTSGWTGSGV